MHSKLVAKANNEQQLVTATFAMGCFWRPDALFGSIGGVVRTRVGYAGGSTVNPTYWHLENHIEAVQFDFDTALVSYQELLKLFFAHHNAARPAWKRQYASAIFYHTPEQLQQAHAAKEEVAPPSGGNVSTLILPLDVFYLAENRHQKHKLQRHPQLMQEFEALSPDFARLLHSTAAARANALLHGYGNGALLTQEICGSGFSAMAQAHLRRYLAEVDSGSFKS